MPAIAVPVLIGTFALGSSLAAQAEPPLPSKTAAELLAMVANNDVKAFSGQITLSTDLGLPQLPDTASMGHATPGPAADGHDGSGAPSISSLLSLITGDHEARVYVDGSSRARIQVFDGMNEQNLIRNGTSLWSYDSTDNTATHTTLPAMSGDSDPDPSYMPTPEDLAQTMLENVDQSTTVSVGRSALIAGRDAYELILTPKTDKSLAERVQIGIDAQTGMPLNVTVDAVGQSDPAVSLGFTSFTPQAPNASLFDFTPPPGTTVTQQQLPLPPARSGKDSGHGAKHEPAMGQDFMFSPSWDAVTVIPAKEVPTDFTGNSELGMLATPVSGGKLLHTSLFNVLIRDDGSVAAGMVPLEVLQSAAGAK